MSKFACPMCGCNQAVEAQRLDRSILVNGYKSLFNYDVSAYFPEQHLLTLQCIECNLRTHHPALPGESGFYDHMQKFPFYYEPDKPEFSYAFEKVIEYKPKTLVEFGCGEGSFLRKIKDICDVRGSEYSQDSIQKLLNAGINLDSDEHVYDFLVTFQVLEHVVDVKAFLQSATDKLVPGGIMLITVPNVQTPHFQERLAILDYPPHHLTQWSRKALDSIARIYGLESIEYYEEPLRLPHYLGVIKARREEISKGGLRGTLVKAISQFADPIIAPYWFDRKPFAGHTHGMLFRKPL